MVQKFPYFGLELRRDSRLDEKVPGRNSFQEISEVWEVVIGVGHRTVDRTRFKWEQLLTKTINFENTDTHILYFQILKQMLVPNSISPYHPPSPKIVFQLFSS